MTRDFRHDEHVSPKAVGTASDQAATESTETGTEGVVSIRTSSHDLPDARLITPDRWITKMDLEVVKSLTPRAKLRAFITCLEVQIFITLVVLADVAAFVAISIYEANGDVDEAMENRFDIVQWIVILVCLVEVVLRLAGFGPSAYLRDAWNVMDALILGMALVVASQLLATRVAKLLKVARWNRILSRIVWCVRVGRLVIQGRKLSVAIRRRVSQNKFRYVDLADNFDLDLTYITHNVVAMAVPTDRCLMSLYRNSLDDVVRFFRMKHLNNFRIYNACPEHPYPDTKFVKAGGQVVRFKIQDHTPPTMNQFVQFIRNADKLRLEKPSAVIAVHCKGGKGRTGSLVCAWLLYAKRMLPDRALYSFARRRTSDAFSKKLCGVETPSQVRYVHQLHRYLELMNSSRGLGGPPPPLTSPAQIILTALHFEDGIIANPAKMGRLKVLVQCGGANISDLAVETDYFNSDVMSLPLNGAVVSGDVRVSVFREKQLKGMSAMDAIQSAKSAYDAKGTIFFFVVHTDFLEMTEHGSDASSRVAEPGKFRVAVEKLDKAHKKVERGRRTHAAGSSVTLQYEKAGCGYAEYNSDDCNGSDEDTILDL